MFAVLFVSGHKTIMMMMMMMKWHVHWLLYTRCTVVKGNFYKASPSLVCTAGGLATAVATADDLLSILTSKKGRLSYIIT